MTLSASGNIDCTAWPLNHLPGYPCRRSRTHCDHPDIPDVPLHGSVSLLNNHMRMTHAGDPTRSVPFLLSSHDPYVWEQIDMVLYLHLIEAPRVLALRESSMGGTTLITLSLAHNGPLAVKSGVPNRPHAAWQPWLDKRSCGSLQNKLHASAHSPRLSCLLSRS